jgi:hypothetical protein
MKYKIYYHLVSDKKDKNIGQVLVVIELTDEKLYAESSKKLRLKILEDLRSKGWSSKVKISVSSNISVTAMKSNIALCFQTGNMGRFYADLLKLQYLYINDKIVRAFYIIPTKQVAKKMGSNLANFERLVDELKLFEKIITVPVFIIGLS